MLWIKWSFTIFLNVKKKVWWLYLDSYIYVQILPPSLVFRVSRYYKRGIRFFGVILERLSLMKSWTLQTNIKNMKLFFIFSFSLMLVVTKSKPIEKPRVILKRGNYAIIDSFKIVSNIYLILVSKRKSFKVYMYLYKKHFKQFLENSQRIDY